VRGWWVLPWGAPYFVGSSSAGGVAAVGEDRLAGDPPALGGEEADDRGDVLDLRELTAHTLRLVELDPLRGLLAVEERRVHRTGRDRGDGDASVGELLGRGASEVLHRRLASGVGGVAVGERGQQRGDDGDDLAAVGEVLAGLLDEE